MKKIYFIILVFLTFSANAQNRYYYNGNDKVEIYPSEDSFIAFEKPSENVINSFSEVKNYENKGFTILKNQARTSSGNDLVKTESKQTIPAYSTEKDGKFKLYPTKIIRVKLNDGFNREDLQKVLTKDEFIRITENYGIYRVRIKNIHKVFDISNKIYESGIADFSVPDFYTPLELNQVNDPLYPLQFQMNNTGQNVDGINGVSDIDCNAPEAWDVSLGDEVIVAVFDQGLEDHEDLGSRLIGGFTPSNNGTGLPELNGDTHGMNCAGVIGATHNEVGLRGVAPNVNLLSVNIFAGGTTHGDIADGIQWAIDNGADVLSNSWSIGNVPCNYTSVDIENALDNAATDGRNGNGAVVVFSAGNDGGCVNYPARNNNVISVGAINSRGNLFNYSSRGPALDLVAPSGQTNGLGNIRTLDRMGFAGEDPGNYEDSFGGTSAACPVVSGVAALVLSLNPDLTQAEVRDILSDSAIDMGVNGFDNNFGNGRVNAQGAVQATLNTLIIEGPNSICQGSSYEGILTIPSSIKNISSINWIVPSYPTYIRSGQGTEELHFSFFSPGNAIIKAEITLNSGTVLEFDKYVFSISSTNNNNPVISLAPDNPNNLTCCNTSGYYDVEHAVLESGYTNGFELEWEWDVQYQDPNDYYTFYDDNDKTALIAVQKHTLSPLIVSVKVRTINDCEAASSWSNDISRYYGTVSGFSSSISTLEGSEIDKNIIDYSNPSLPIDAYYIENNKELYINYLNKYDWLNVNYANKNLSKAEVKTIIQILESSDKIDLNIFDFQGNIVYSRKLESGTQQVNLSKLKLGVYIAKYTLGSIDHTTKFIVQ